MYPKSELQVFEMGYLREVELSPLMSDSVVGEVKVLNHAKYDDVDRILKAPPGPLAKPIPPSSHTHAD